MATSFTFSNFSPKLAHWRGELEVGYQATVKQLSQSSSGGDRAVDWQTRMNKRILEADEDMATRRSVRARRG